MRNVKMTIWVMVMTVCLYVLPTFGVLFNDGLTHNITTNIFDHVWVDYQAPGMQTTVNLLAGAAIPSPYELVGWNDSRLNISGGSVYYLAAFSGGQITISGGSLGGLGAYGSGQITISDGSVGHLSAFNRSQITISGGSVGNLAAYSESQITMSGGTIGSGLLCQSAELTIDGFNFAVDGNPYGFGKITSILGGSWMEEPYRLLTGTLANGDVLNSQFQIGDSASITLVPEPATLGLLLVGSLALLRRRRSV